MKSVLFLAILVAVAAAARAAPVATVQASRGACMVCELVVGEAEKVLEKNATEARVQYVLEEICSRLPSGLKKSCQGIAEQLPAIVAMLLSKEDPPTVCQQVGLCDKPSAATGAESSAVATATAMTYEHCTTCKTYAQMLLSFTSDVGADVRVLEGLCARLQDRKLAAECKTLVDTVGPLVIQQLVSMSPERLCSLIRLCEAPASGNGGLADMFQRIGAGAVGAAFHWPVLLEPQQCGLCKLVVGLAKEVLHNETIDMDALRHACSYLPGSLSQSCTALVDEWGPALVELIETMDAEQLCQLIKQCPPSVGRPMPRTKVPLCAICKAGVQELEQFASGPTAEAAIEGELVAMCKRLPSDVRGICKSLVLQYVPVAIEYLKKLGTPERVCTGLRVCEPSVQITIPGGKCALCEFFVGTFENWIERNLTQQEIDAALQRVCTALPTQFRDQCAIVMDEYAPKIEELILEKADPANVCRLAGLCGRGAQGGRSARFHYGNATLN